MTSGFASTFIREQREVTQEQKRFLRDVIAYYDELGNQDEGSISEVRSAANAAYRVGGIYERLGEQELAIKHFALAVTRYRKLVKLSQQEASVGIGRQMLSGYRVLSTAKVMPTATLAI